jgi:hypothetical protein
MVLVVLEQLAANDLLMKPAQHGRRGRRRY